MHFGRAIAAARAKAGISQVEFAERLGVSTGTVAAWELAEIEGSEGHGFRMERLPEIAKALGISVAALVRKAS